DGTTIVYTITEDKVEDYKTTIKGFTVRNLYTGDLPNAGTTQTALPIVGAVMALAGVALTLKKKRN
ncbi:MAG: LPXTG cell wall anchor domain-containing protein, partial [Clostridium sp.]|nr:LPXTG cell wall anchor domain-containing protein [Clostridium sp.]